MATLMSYISPSRSRKVLRQSKKAVARSRDLISDHPAASILGGLFTIGAIAVAIWLFPEFIRYMKVRRM